jgi:MoxR-like ATPase
MSDRQVSVDGQTRPLESPFLVLATQNPYEFEGTFPLPESQLDRFLMRLRLGYPDRDTEKEVLIRHRQGEPVESLGPVLSVAEVRALQQQTRQVRVEDALNDYILDLIGATRTHKALYLGASTRAALALYRATQALALVQGRTYVIPDDVKHLAKAVLAHRLLARRYRPGERGDEAEVIMDEIIGQTPVPV